MAKQKKVKKKQAERHTRKIACSGADRFFFYLWQFTWGLPVNIFGFIAYLIMYKGHRHENSATRLLHTFRKTSAAFRSDFLYLSARAAAMSGLTTRAFTNTATQFSACF